MSQFSPPGSVLIKTTLMKSRAEQRRCGAPRVVVHPDRVLAKQVQTIVTGRQRDAQRSKFLDSIHF